MLEETRLIRSEKERLEVRRNVESKRTIRNETTIRSEKIIEKERNRLEVKRPFETQPIRMEMFPFEHCLEGNGDVSSVCFWADTFIGTNVVFTETYELTNFNVDTFKHVFLRFQQLLSQLEAHGAEVSTEDANHKFLRSFPPAWSNLAMTMRTKPEVDTLSIDDLYNNLRVFEQEIQEVLAGLLLKLSISLFAKPSVGRTGTYFMKIGTNDDLDIERDGHIWQIGWECTAKGTLDGKKKRDSFYQHQEAGKQEKNQMGLLTMDDGIVNCNEVSLCSKTCIDSYNTLKLLCDEQMNQAVKKLEAQLVTSQKYQLSLNEKLTFQANEIHEKDENLKRYMRIGMKAVKEKEQLQKTVDSWKDTSKNLWRLINSGMISNDKLGLGYEIQSNDEVLSYEEEMNFFVFKCSKEDSIGKPLYSRFTKTNDFKGVPHPLSGDYTPKPQDEGSCGNTSEHSFETESESISVPNEMSTSRLVVTNEKVVSELQEVEPSCAKHVKTPRQPLKDKETHKVNRKNWNDMMERELGEGYSFTKKKCFVCGSLSHLIKDCDYYEKKMAREAEVRRVVNTGNGVAKPVWTNANRINHSNKFVPRSVQLNAGRPKFNSVRPNINTGRTNINSVRPKVNAVSSNINTVRSRQPVPNKTSNSLSPKRPQMNQINQRRDFSKPHSSVRRPFAKTTTQMSHSNAVMGNWGSAVKTSASYNWRNSRPNFNYNHGLTFIRTEYPLKNMVDRGIFDSGCSGHMTSNKDQLEDFEEFNEGSITFGGFAEIVDFLQGSNLRYALTSNPTIYDSLVKQFWQTATTNTVADGTLEINATIDTIGYTITEASIRDTLQLGDATGITMLPNDEIFEGMGQMGYPTDGTFTFWKSFFTPQWRYLVHHLFHYISSQSSGWDQFGSNIATALICLTAGRIYNFSKLIFDGMVANLKSKTKFLMYPRFLQLILNIPTENKHPYLAVTLTKKIFGNMKRGFRGALRPLLPAMLLVATTNPNACQEHHAMTQTQPSSSTLPVPSTSPPPIHAPTPPTSTPTPPTSTPTPPTSTPTPIPASILTPIPASIPTPTPISETEPEPIEHNFEEPFPTHQHFSPPQE
ncbi:hypothetical protein Tco_0453052 [Tanacetum coccineum]